MVSLEQFIESEEWQGKEGRLPDGRYKATYDKIGGCWNIGPGLTHGINKNTVMTRAEIDEAYGKELLPFERLIDSCVHATLTKNQYVALVSFSYNVGEGTFRKSSVLSLANQGKLDQVPAHLKLYVHGRSTGSKVIPGLVNRRNAEAKLWATPDELAFAAVHPSEAESSVQPPAYVPHYDPAYPVPKGAVTLEVIMSELSALVNVPISSTTAIIDQTGHKIVTATQSGLLVFLTYVLTHFSSAWDLLGVNSSTVSVYAAGAIIAFIEWYKHSWVSNSNDTTTTIINSLEAKLKELEN